MAKKMLDNLLDSAGNEILINGALAVDPSSGESFSGHASAGNKHLPSPENAGKVLVSTADGGSQWVDRTTLGLDDAMHFKGTIGEGGTVEAVPAIGYRAGDTYKVITAGDYAGHMCEVGDLLMAVLDALPVFEPDPEDPESAEEPQVIPEHWAAQQTNIDGAVVGPAASQGNTVPVFDGESGKVIRDSGFTLGASVPEGAVFHSGIALMGDAEDVPVFDGKLSLVLVEYNPG